MKVRGRERVGFNFKDLLISFASGNDINEDDLEKELSVIRKQENSSAISALEKATDPTRFAKVKKAGNRRKRSGLDIKTVEVKQAEAKEIDTRTSEYEER